MRARVPSPFDYPAQTRVFIVTDVRKDDSTRWPPPIARCSWPPAAAGSACSPRSRGCAPCTRRIARPLDEAGLPLLAQHVDGLDAATLVDIFRAEEDACLLGTDAVRDGVDVPGRSLRLIVFDRVPWPRPDILHKARARPPSAAAPMTTCIARLRLRQAFGRLIRRADDHGVFVLLDPHDAVAAARARSRMASSSQRVGLAEAVAARARVPRPGARRGHAPPGR